MYTQVLIFSMLGIVVSIVCGGENITVKEIVCALMPIMSEKYWYITTYILILLFSSFINRIPNSLSKNEFQIFLAIYLVVFSIVPTFLTIHIIGDNGKGSVNMLLIYC